LCTSEKTKGTNFPDRRPLFYYITDRHQFRAGTESALLIAIRRAAAWGVDFIQIREKDLSDLELFRLTRKVLRLTATARCRILVNGRLDIALACGAHGVHLPSTGLAIPDLKPHLPEGFILGMSTHSEHEARRAARAGACYILLGPVFPTPSKISLGVPLGLRRFERICSSLSIPVIGLGGIRRHQIADVLDAGAAGIAGIRLFQQDIKFFPRSSLGDLLNKE
jgi:thiamine-phosphate pyrophosphorylase